MKKAFQLFIIQGLLFAISLTAYATGMFSPPAGEVYRLNIHRIFNLSPNGTIISDSAGTSVIYNWKTLMGSVNPRTTFDDNSTGHYCFFPGGTATWVTNRVQTQGDPTGPKLYGKGDVSCPDFDK